MLEQKEDEPLDSVMLQWKRKNEKIFNLPSSTLIAWLRSEVKKFESMKKSQCRKNAQKFREALIELSRDKEMAAAYATESNPDRLRRTWVTQVKAFIKTVSKKRKERELIVAKNAVHENSFVGKLLKSLPEKRGREEARRAGYPGGKPKRPRVAKLPRSDASDTETSDDESGFSSSSEDEVLEAKKAKKAAEMQAQSQKPLEINEEGEQHVSVPA